MINFIQVDFEHLTCSGSLGDGVTLPHSDELQRALEIVYDACDREARRRQGVVEEEFLLEKRTQMEKEPANISKILHEILNYHRDRKSSS